MAHQRETIMVALQAALAGQLPPAIPLFRQKIMPTGSPPFVVFYQDSEAYLADDLSQTLTPTLQVVIKGVGQTTSETQLNNVGDVAIWKAIEADVTLGGAAIDLHQVASVFDVETVQGSPRATMTKTIEIKYRVQRTDPEVSGA